MNEIEVIEVWMNGSRVGRIALTPDALCAFEYDASWLTSGESISPLFLPLQSRLFVAKRNPFNGGFGVFDDSLPDGWGHLILDRYLKSKNLELAKLTTLQRLALVGLNGRGSLEYYPDLSNFSSSEIVDFNYFAIEIKNLLESNHTGASLDALYTHGGSPGGARPKLFVHIEGKEWLVKFKATYDPNRIGEVEYEYAQLAKECGISMPETRLFDGKYFGVERFDRTSTGKIHTVSAAGLLHTDYRIPSLDYLDLLKLCHYITKDIEEVYALFRLMVFNVVIGNRDDHAKNFSFQWSGKKWRLSPAYDLLPGSGFNGYHTTTINNSGSPTVNDIFTVSEKAGLNKQRAKEMYQQIHEMAGKKGFNHVIR